MRKCCLCGSYRRNTFSFPKAKELRKRWLSICQIKQADQSMTVCTRHFRPADIQQQLPGKTRLCLKSDAVPCLLLPSSGARDSPVPGPSSAVDPASTVGDPTWTPGSYLRFPNDSARQERWKNIVGVRDLVYSSGVCIDHFRPQDLSFNERRTRLRPNASPSLKLGYRPSHAHHEMEAAEHLPIGHNVEQIGEVEAIPSRTSTPAATACQSEEMADVLFSTSTPATTAGPSEEMADVLLSTSTPAATAGQSELRRSGESRDADSELASDADASEDDLEAPVEVHSVPEAETAPLWDVRSGVVSEPQLRQLLTEMPAICQQCRKEVSPNVGREGVSYHVTWRCRRCGADARRAWHSSQRDGQAAVFDSVFAAAVTVSGCSTAGVQKLLAAANLGMLSPAARQRIGDKTVPPAANEANGTTTTTTTTAAARRPRGLVCIGD